MARISTGPLVRPAERDEVMQRRVAASASHLSGRFGNLADTERWFNRIRRQTEAHACRVPLDSLDGWTSGPETGTIRHDSGKFFTVEGLDVHIPGRAIEHWRQPIICQPEIGILGIVVKDFDGVLHCLMQAKYEPGNCNGLQISPTVQATRSNYTRVHRGSPVAYLDHFRASHHRVVADVRQSEQGAWFLQKRNRNMIVEVTEDVELYEGFRWLTIGQIHRLLRIDDLVNMDARTVLSCLPFAGPGLFSGFKWNRAGFESALLRSCSTAEGCRQTTVELLSWITEARTSTDLCVRRVPLNDIAPWRRTSEKIAHESGRFFDVIGVKVSGADREVREWSQPMFETHGTGIVAFLVREFHGVLHILVQARVEPGSVDVVELAPTVQCTPDNYLDLPAEARPSFLDDVLTAVSGQVRFEATLSEEGGRFYRIRNRYLVVETEKNITRPGFRWMTMYQLADLLRHSNYVNVQARSLVACMHSLVMGAMSGD